jgi:hypothetical protein
MFTVIVQKELLRELSLPAVEGIEIFTFSSENNWKEILTEKANNLTGPTQVHCSLEIANWITKNFPNHPLGHGISLPKENINAHQQLGRLGSLMLNEIAYFLPFGRLEHQWESLQRIMGPDLFLRPDSCMKIFAGRPVKEEDFKIEMATLHQIDRVQNDVLCQISPHKTFSLPEWRCWMVDTEIAAFAPYAFEKDVSEFKDLPEDIGNLARKAADRFIDIDSLIVIDCVRDSNGTPKVMEANGFSTSGFYPGVDFKSLWTHTQKIYGL